MKIAIVGPAYPFRGGIAHFSGCLAKALDRESHQTFLINLQRQYPALLFPGSTQTEENSSFSDLASDRVLTPYNRFSYNKTFRKIVALDVDLVIFSFFLPFFAPAYLYLLKRLSRKGVKTMLLAHNIDFHEKWLFGKYLTKKLVNRSDYILTLSESVYNGACTLLKRGETKVIPGFHPLYDFHNCDLYTVEQAKEKLNLQDKKVILFFGYIKPYKGVDLLINAFTLLKKRISNAQLLIAGEIYGNKQQYYDLIKKTGYEKDIMLFDRYVGSEEVELFFKAADVLVLPYRQATQSGVLQTAYIMDLGVVVTPVGGLPEMVIPDKTGVIAKSISEEDLCSAMEHYFSLDRNKIRENIKEFRDSYSWHKLIKIIEEAI